MGVPDMMIYDRELFESFRAKAVTKPEQLVPGRTYYSNLFDPFVLKEVVDYKTLCESRGENSSDLGGLENTLWMIKENGKDDSLSDNNIGQSYNPWLIFENEQDARECREQLKISHSNEYYDWDDYDDWSYDDENA
jgi:hypothetical protein